MLKKMMKHRINELEVLLVIFIIFVCIGSLYGSLSASKNMENYSLIFDFFNNKMIEGNIIRTDLFEFLLLSRLKLLAAIWIIGFILYALYIDCFAVGFFGFNFGLILSATLLYKGIYGFVFVIILILPQSLIYVPVVIYLIRKNLNFSKSLYGSRKNQKLVKMNGQLLFEYFLVFIISGAFMIIGVISEAYVNIDLINWYLLLNSF